MREHNYYVYILASRKNGYFYTGVTNNLVRRDWEHKNGISEGYTKKYNIHMLVYYECTTDIYAAIQREKTIKKWKRKYKINAIERMNPEWKDLYYVLLENKAYNPAKSDSVLVPRPPAG